jgi:hypothetical protein
MSCPKIRGKRGPAGLSSHAERCTASAVFLRPSVQASPVSSFRIVREDRSCRDRQSANGYGNVPVCVWPRPLPTHQQTPHRRPQRSRLHSLASRKTETSSGAPEFVETLYCQVAAQVGEKPEGFSFRSHLEHRKLKHKNIEIEVYVFWISIGTKIT